MNRKNLYHVVFTEDLLPRVLIGAAIAFALISLFVFGVDNPKPEWPEYWRLRPLIITTIAGGIGGAFFDFMHLLRREGSWKKVLGLLLGLIGYLVILWLGSILGLDGTLWN